MQEESLLEEMSRVRPELLNEQTLRLYNKIMQVLDERDELIKKVALLNEMNTTNYNKYCEILKENIQTKYKTYEELKEELGNKYDKYMYDINLDLIKKIDTALDKIQLLIDIGFDYDGFNQVESLKGLIDELVSYAKESRAILRGDSNE